ncbi:MAG: phosphoadenosine phosphosulfate reductase family protein [Magnetococcales bacterium]|nr:phosphoadenosine phosphosulfate reductase family protein [Magnetococcales bacterium]
MGFWLSYGGGVNSTALAVMVVHGLLPKYGDVKFIFSDTGNEKPETIQYIKQIFIPYLQKYGRDLVVVKAEETVLERWQRYKMTGSRTLRSCTDHGKIRPIMDFVRKVDDSPEQLVGIDAGESHRAKPANKKKREFPKHYPLVERGIDRKRCIEIIKDAGIRIPVKSGCWHCPFMRVREILSLANTFPEQFEKIILLEDVCRTRMIIEGKEIRSYYQWRDKPAIYWWNRAKQEAKQMSLNLEWDDIDPNIPCICYD